jgi:hypothetical protein
VRFREEIASKMGRVKSPRKLRSWAWARWNSFVNDFVWFHLLASYFPSFAFDCEELNDILGINRQFVGRQRLRFRGCRFDRAFVVVLWVVFTLKELLNLVALTVLWSWQVFFELFGKLVSRKITSWFQMHVLWPR